MDRETLEALDEEGAELFKTVEDASLQRDRTVRRIQLTLEGLARRLRVVGQVRMFGSFSNGFKTGSSDLDVNLVSTEVTSDKAVGVLQQFASEAADFGFINVTKIYQANVPIVKFSDGRSGIEVDFCVNNNLGVRNSMLLLAYCNYDKRVLYVGRMIKDWAKRREIVGTADGYLNSYAYMLLTIYYLQSLQPPVVPNLQAMASDDVWVKDIKWGSEDQWNTKFLEDISELPPSENTMSLAELVTGFFLHYSRNFSWRTHAVCMRLASSGKNVDKYSLSTPSNEEQWYVEDPFDLKHNLAGKCTRAGRKHILDEMWQSYQRLCAGGTWASVCGSGPDSFFLKCRVSESVTPQMLMAEFIEFDVTKVHYPKMDGTGRMAQAFLEFDCSANRRRAHTRNEAYVADVQLQLHYSSRQALREAYANLHYTAIDPASFKMQRQVLQARMNRPDDYPAAANRESMGAFGAADTGPGSLQSLLALSAGYAGGDIGGQLPRPPAPGPAMPGHRDYLGAYQVMQQAAASRQMAMQQAQRTSAALEEVEQPKPQPQPQPAAKPEPVPKAKAKAKETKAQKAAAREQAAREQIALQRASAVAAAHAALQAEERRLGSRRLEVKLQNELKPDVLQRVDAETLDKLRSVGAYFKRFQAAPKPPGRSMVKIPVEVRLNPASDQKPVQTIIGDESWAVLSHFMTSMDAQKRSFCI